MNDLWRKSALLGSLWAASEIVLGSFLHNARVPLTGHILTGIGIAILTAGHRLWPRTGLLWRAGLVCAAMKSVSPSAVILSPMVAISMEGFLVEAGVFLAGANPAGYLLGGALAMSWPLFHTLGGAFLYYGPETVAVYVRGLERLRAWLGAAPGSAWTPLLAIWAAHILGGFAAALAGLRVGRKGARAPAAAKEPRSSEHAVLPSKREKPASRNHSLTALALHVVCVAAAMSLGARLAVWAFAAAAGVYAAGCVSLYPRAGSIMKRFSLWFGILMVSALAGLILSRWESGVQMGLRAVILTLGFACIGEELRNPLIRSWLERAGGRAFFEALDQAFATLPAVFAGLPPGAELVRSPLESLRAAIFRAPALLEALERTRAFIITGERGIGKSSLASSLAESLRRSGASIGGVLAPGLWEDGVRSGFDIVDLGTGERRTLCRRNGPREWQALGAFRFSPEGLAFGLKALSDARRKDPDLVVVDEVGPLELQGQGWAPELKALAAERRKPMVWVVRSGLVAEVRRKWGLARARVWDAGTERAESLLTEILPEAS